ncbi:hypothetical protein K470DRAFT_221503 [Piedraia hortae CBS 480.64]|uniref:G-patch domain-containing protein n=1 Tax=Piedraia hortae CBS 480.64 TaxID=1314780 RepID=A0A6A7BT07_9PEZI|nr:hypothetical protein K470DRAFT_221503 [Piedraia hortae CBS 480.64]
MADEEDDYLSMSFAEEPKRPETSLQRVSRLKREARDRGRIMSKKERAEMEEITREIALATPLDTSTNKGARMMAKMGFTGGALGKSEDGNARTQPLPVQLKNDRGGIGVESEKKKRIRDLAGNLEQGFKRQKMDEQSFRERTREEHEERRAEGQMWRAMRTLESFESEDGEVKDSVPLKAINLYWRPLVKQRREKEGASRRIAPLRNEDSDSEDEDGALSKTLNGGEDALQGVVDEDDDDDPELEEFEALSFAERLERIVFEMRHKYHYCFWCKHRYADDKEMEECPGQTEDEHD